MYKSHYTSDFPASRPLPRGSEPLRPLPALEIGDSEGQVEHRPDGDYTEIEESEVSLSDEDKSWINEQLDRVREQMERVETSLLTEFHKWASPVEARQRSHTAALRAFDLEMESLSDRVK
jgi:hypothetical protein